MFVSPHSRQGCKWKRVLDNLIYIVGPFPNTYIYQCLHLHVQDRVASERGCWKAWYTLLDNFPTPKASWKIGNLTRMLNKNSVGSSTCLTNHQFVQHFVQPKIEPLWAIPLLILAFLFTTLILSWENFLPLNIHLSILLGEVCVCVGWGLKRTKSHACSH